MARPTKGMFVPVLVDFNGGPEDSSGANRLGALIDGFDIRIVGDIVNIEHGWAATPKSFFVDAIA